MWLALTKSAFLLDALEFPLLEQTKEVDKDVDSCLSVYHSCLHYVSIPFHWIILNSVIKNIAGINLELGFKDFEPPQTENLFACEKKKLAVKVSVNKFMRSMRFRFFYESKKDK